MCELLALSANTPTDMRFSFRGLTRRGGATGDHGDGWGLASFDPEGKNFELFSMGERNPVDQAFNKDGELFLYDSDMEWDMGTPWYRPTNVQHVISGADAGNYVLSATSTTALAEILAKAITATLSANGKTYDGTTNVTLTATNLSNIVNSDTVTVPVTNIFLMRAALFRARRAGRDVPPSLSRQADQASERDS